MRHWLLKQEPTDYSWPDLVRDGTTEWSGVHNALALQHLRRMAVGDLALFYHTGSERSAIGIAEVTSTPRPDPKDARGSWTVDVRPVRPLRRAVTLAELRTDRGLDGLALLTFSRLSVVPVSDPHWRRILAHEKTGPPSAPPARRSSAPR